MNNKKFDAIVVGAGPAGSSAARRLCQLNRTVLLIDQAKFPREKACGGGLTGNVEKFLDFDISSVIETKVTSTLCVFRGKILKRLEPKGLNVSMIRRPKFDHLLAMKAKEAGAVFAENARLNKIMKSNGRYLVETTAGNFESSSVIGADGALSPTARVVGLRNKMKLGIAMEAEVLPRKEMLEKWQKLAIFDFGVVPKGYGWVFPKQNSFSIGVGTVENKFPDARKHLDDLIRRHECVRNPNGISIRSAPLPYWEKMQPLAENGVFLVGDAGGLVDPLSGEGISYAIRSGKTASEFINEFLNGVLNSDHGYTEEIERTIARNFEFAGKLASIFFRYPVATYILGVRSKIVNDIFARLISGKIDYSILYEEIRSSLPGRAYRLLKPILSI